MIDITCTGEEERLVGCEYEFTGTTRHFCSRISPQDSMDASVRCIQGTLYINYNTEYNITDNMQYWE